MYFQTPSKLYALLIQVTVRTKVFHVMGELTVESQKFTSQIIIHTTPIILH